MLGARRAMLSALSRSEKATLPTWTPEVFGMGHKAHSITIHEADKSRCQNAPWPEEVGNRYVKDLQMRTRAPGSMCLDYRPISVLLVPGKVFAHILCVAMRVFSELYRSDLSISSGLTVEKTLQTATLNCITSISCDRFRLHNLEGSVGHPRLIFPWLIADYLLSWTACGVTQEMSSVLDVSVFQSGEVYLMYLMYRDAAGLTGF